MKIAAESYGVLPDGREVILYILENNSGMRVEVLNYGGIIRSIQVPDRNGNPDDVVLGHPDLEAYIANPGYLGAVVGRSANRIAGPNLHILDSQYPLECNDGANNLHSGAGGLSFQLFASEVHTFNNLPVLLLHYILGDQADGFPGNLELNIIYALTAENALMIDYRAVSDAYTVINFTNHSYFNLAGHNSGTIYGHELELNGQFYTPAGPDGIPTGEILSVMGTPLDFTTPKPLGKDISSSYPQLQQYGGYDHNYVLSGNDYRKVASVWEPVSGRSMEVFTDLPGMQLYTANHMEMAGKDDVAYQKHQGFCLETQFFPNAVHIPWFPTPIFADGEEYSATTTYQFSVK